MNWAKDVEEAAAGSSRNRTKASKSLPEQQQGGEKGKEDEEAQTETSEKSEQQKQQTQDQNEAVEKRDEQSPQVESFAAAVLPATEAEGGSRFYIKRKIIVGNVSKFVPPGKKRKKH